MKNRIIVHDYLANISKQVDILSFLKAEEMTNQINDKILYQIDQQEFAINHYRDHIDGQQIRNYGIGGFSRHKSHSVPHIQYFISEITEEDKIRARQMMEQQQLYHKRLEDKARNLEQQLRYEEEHKKIQKQQKRIEIFESKKHLFREGIERIKQRQQKRKRQLSQQNLKLKKVIRQKTLHEKLMEKWAKQKEIKQKQKEEAYILLKEKKKVDFKQIREHQLKYEEQKNKVVKGSRATESSGVYSEDEPLFYRSVFFSRIVEEEENFKEKVFEKQRLAKQFAEKRTEYAKIVRENYQPRIRESSRFKLKNPEQSFHRSMSHAEIVNKGNDYLRTCLEQIRKKSRTRPLFRPSEEKKKFQYKNYLTELREKKNSPKNQTTKLLQAKSEKKYENQIKSIMAKPDLSKEQKFLRAKLATKKMEQIQGKKNPYNLIDSINAKIQILKNVAG